MQVFLMFFAYLNESSYRRESLSTDGCCWITGQWIEGTETASVDKQKAGVSWPSLCENRNVAFRNWTIWGYEGKILWMVANSCTTKRMVEAQQNHGMFTTYQLVGFSRPFWKPHPALQSWWWEDDEALHGRSWTGVHMGHGLFSENPNGRTVWQRAVSHCLARPHPGVQRKNWSLEIGCRDSLQSCDNMFRISDNNRPIPVVSGLLRPLHETFISLWGHRNL